MVFPFRSPVLSEIIPHHVEIEIELPPKHFKAERSNSWDGLTQQWNIYDFMLPGGLISTDKLSLARPGRPCRKRLGGFRTRRVAWFASWRRRRNVNEEEGTDVACLHIKILETCDDDDDIRRWRPVPGLLRVLGGVSREDSWSWRRLITVHQRFFFCLFVCLCHRKWFPFLFSNGCDREWDGKNYSLGRYYIQPIVFEVDFDDFFGFVDWGLLWEFDFQWYHFYFVRQCLYNEYKVIQIKLIHFGLWGIIYGQIGLGWFDLTNEKHF